MESLIDKVTSLSLRRGIIFPNSDIYGSFAGFFDYGNYGSEIKRNVESSWWRHFVNSRDDIVGIDGSIVTHPEVWHASGHVESFNDPLVECKKCHKRFRADHLVESALNMSVDGMSMVQIQDVLSKHKIKCPNCKGDFTLVKMFNLMFKTHVGATQDESAVAYLRPETAQLIFTDFKQILNTSRKKLPFGIAQVGRAFRNEISPRNFVFRAREFSQMEIEYFIHPKKMDDCPYLTKRHKSMSVNVLTSEDQEKDGKHSKMKIGDLLEEKTIKTPWHAYWVAESIDWLLSLGVKPENLRIRQHTKTELSHYALETWDIEYNYPWGWKELQGIANRTDFDLKQHAKWSNKDLSYFDDESKERVIPHVIEPSIGVDRLILTLIIDAYSEKKDKDGVKTILSLGKSVAPVHVSVLPLMKKDGLDKKAKELAQSLRKDFVVEYDDAGSIGKRYARNDEIGTPYSVTIDYDSMEKDDCTVRDRDTTKQVRVKTADLADVLAKLMKDEIAFEKAGKLLKK
jgi:glycyl-tRNA synthetase